MTGQSWVDGWRVGGSSAFFAINPETGEELNPPYWTASSETVDLAATAAANAFEEMEQSPPAQRGMMLRFAAEELEAREEMIVARGMLETGLQEPRLRGELARTTGQLRMFASLVEEGSWVNARIDHGDGKRKPLPKPDVRFTLQPLGPVAVFGASNFPLAFSVAGGDTASALAAGCPVVVKAHPSHPGTSEFCGAALAAAVRRAGLPPGAFSLIFDGGIEVGLEIVRHPDLRAVGFTGSRAGGLALLEAARKRKEPIPVYAEMSSINPVLILPEALAALSSQLVQGLAASITLGVGQFCTEPGLVFIPGNEDGIVFAKALAGALAKVEPATMLCRGIARNYAKGIEDCSAEVLLQGGTDGCVARAALFRTNAREFLSNPELHRENFGPASLLVTYRDVAELMTLAERLEGQLTASIHGEPGELAAHPRLLRVLARKAGRVIINGFPTGVEVCASMNHGGPFPATTDACSTSVGTYAIYRWVRPVCYQDVPEALLPEALREANPLRIQRIEDGVRQRTLGAKSQ